MIQSSGRIAIMQILEVQPSSKVLSRCLKKMFIYPSCFLFLPMPPTPEPEFVNISGAQESIARNRFRQPMQPSGPLRQIGLLTGPLGGESILGSLTDLQVRARNYSHFSPLSFLPFSNLLFIRCNFCVTPGPCVFCKTLAQKLVCQRAKPQDQTLRRTIGAKYCHIFPLFTGLMSVLTLYTAFSSCIYTLSASTNVLC